MNLPSTPVLRLVVRRLAVFAVLGSLLALAMVASPALAQSPAPEESPTASPSPERSPLTQNRPVLGILGFTAPEGRGVTIARVVPGTGADDAELEAGDLITDLEGNRVASMEDLTTAMQTFRAGDDVTITYERDGESRTAEVTLGTADQAREPDRSPFEVIPDPDFDDDPPRRDDPGPSRSTSDEIDYRPVITLFGILITGAIVALIVVLARRNRPVAPSPEPTTADYVPASAPTRADAMEVLRLRYARGEINRDEFLSMSADLGGGSSSPASESPTKEL
ncbi:MAG TPA: PDZ domain-containing protein [Actinomycetota bacterium]|nr:PDZ domain-containing protein [Actinomycetota bacterium]